MSVSSIIDLSQNPSCQNGSQSAIAEFKQLAADLRSGNLSQAQADYATLAKNAPAAAQNTSTPLGQAFSALGQALESGDLSAAQQALAAVTHRAGHHAHHGAPLPASSSASTEPAASGASGSGGLSVMA